MNDKDFEDLQDSRDAYYEDLRSAEDGDDEDYIEMHYTMWNELNGNLGV